MSSTVSSLYSYFMGASPSNASVNGSGATTTNKAQLPEDQEANEDKHAAKDVPSSSFDNDDETGISPSETTALLSKQKQQPPTNQKADPFIDPALVSCTETATANPTVNEFFFPNSNPSIQRYYQFQATTLAPIAALHKKPGSNGGVTGLLRRSAVVPSHGTDQTGEWVLVSVGGRSGWARVKQPSESNHLMHLNNHSNSDKSPTDIIMANNMPSQYAGFAPASTFRAFEAWMGNHVFLCKGKLMLGSDAPSLFFTNGLLIVGLSIYFFYVMPKLTQLSEINKATHEHLGLADPTFWLDHPVLVYTISGILTVCTFATLWATALTDPGILPAISSPMKPPAPTDSEGRMLPLGGPSGYRYCSTCNIFRPPRSKHCNSCNCCVTKFDHHCPWTGNCIGERNYRIFFMFLLSISILLVLITAVSIRLLLSAYQYMAVLDTPGIGPVVEVQYKDVLSYSERTSHRLWNAMLSMPMVCLFGIFVLLCAWSLLSLLFYHAAIISMAQTTNERVRGVFRATGAGSSNRNPADKGCCRNWIAAMCSKLPPSRLPPDFSKNVDNMHSTRDEFPWPGATDEDGSKELGEPSP